MNTHNYKFRDINILLVCINTIYTPPAHTYIIYIIFHQNKIHFATCFIISFSSAKNVNS